MRTRPESPPPPGRGRITIGHLAPGGARLPGVPVANAWMDTYAHIVARCLAGDPAARPGALYLEFANGATPGSVTPGSVGRGDTLGHYAALGDTADRDFLRLVVGRPTLDRDPAYAAYLAADRGNRLTYTAQTAGGVVGVHGKPFGATHGSVVYGVALAATPGGDWTEDILFGRAYYAPDVQVPALAGLQVYGTYEVVFGLDG